MKTMSKGSVLLLVILVAGALFFLAAVSLSAWQQNRQLALHGAEDAVADAAAVAGIDAALWEINQNPGWTTGFADVSLTHTGTGVASRPYASYSMTFVPKAGVPYSTNNASAAPVQGYQGVTVPAGLIHLVSQGRYNGRTRIEEAIVGPFNSGVVVAQTITLKGQGTIGGNIRTNLPWVNPVDPSPGNPPYVTLSGNGAVTGTVTLGPGGNAATDVSSGKNPPVVQISKTPVNLVPLVPPTGINKGDVNLKNKNLTLPSGTYGNLNMAGKSTLTLVPGGVYVFTGNINGEGQTQIVVPAGNSPVLMYVLGSVKFAGQITNLADAASNFWLIGDGIPKDMKDMPDITLSGGSAMTLAIYAPYDTLTLTGQGDLTGCFIGFTLTQTGNGRLTFDPSVRNGVKGIMPSFFSAFSPYARWSE